MLYIDKYDKLKPFVNLKIPHNKKRFTSSEKSLITKYYNKLKAQGYFHREMEGFVTKDISRSKIKIKGSPRLKKVRVNVGTKVVNGKIVTDTANKVIIKNKKIYVNVVGKGMTWRFNYDIKKDWTTKEFAKHLLEQMGQENLKKGQYFAIGAGIYEMSSTKRPLIENIAEKILQVANRYASNNQKIMDGEIDGEYVDYSEFMQEVVVHENREVAEAFTSLQRKRKKKTKRDRIRMK